MDWMGHMAMVCFQGAASIRPAEHMSSIIPLIHTAFETCTGITSLALNLILLWAIRNHSASLKYFKSILLFGCLNDVYLCLITLTCQPAVATNKGYIVVFCNNHILPQKRYLCVILMTLQGSSIMCNVICLPIQFVYRHSFVVYGKPPKRWLLHVVVTGTVVVACHLVFVNLAHTPEEFTGVARRIMEGSGWMFDRDMVMVGGGLNEGKVMLFSLFCVLCSVSCYTTILIYEMSIFRELRVLSAIGRTQVNADIHRALTALAVCPLFTSTIPVCTYICSIVFCMDLGTAPALFTSVLSLAAVVNPLTTAFFVRPYRRAILAKLLRRHTSVHSISSCGKRSGYAITK